MRKSRFTEAQIRMEQRHGYADSAYARGRVMVRAMRDVDVGVRHGESFAVAEDVVTVAE